MADEERNQEEEEIKKECADRARKKMSKVAKFLEEVALNDKYRDTRSVKIKVVDGPGEFHYEYEEQQFPVSVSVRVTAAKTWKELIADKAIGDIKEKAKAPKREGLDMKAAMEAVAKAKAKEAAKAESDEATEGAAPVEEAI